MLSTYMVKDFFGWKNVSEFSVQISNCNHEESCLVHILKSLLSSLNKDNSDYLLDYLNKCVNINIKQDRA